jgi:mannose-6-phosphate isomerase class I
MTKLEDRIMALERHLSEEEWPVHTVIVMRQDCSKSSGDEGEVWMIIKSGSPTVAGASYHRGETETLEAFQKRVDAAEAERMKK